MSAILVKYSTQKRRESHARPDLRHIIAAGYQDYGGRFGILDIGHQLVEPIPAGDVQPSPAMVHTGPPDAVKPSTSTLYNLSKGTFLMKKSFGSIGAISEHCSPKGLETCLPTALWFSLKMRTNVF